MLLTNIKRLVTCEGEVIEEAAIKIRNEKIEWFGPQDNSPDSRIFFDCEEGAVTPGLIDCHTHLVHAGFRQNEFADRAAGKTYLEIAKAGGGILSTVKATRKASYEELLQSARRRAAEAMHFGTTTLEIKSGYGLDLETELKMLRVIDQLRQVGPQNVIATFLGAHTIPREYKIKPEEYVRILIEEMLPKVASEKLATFCDIFVEQEAFDKRMTDAIMKAAQKLGLKTKFHVDQLSSNGGAELAASCQAVSADHLEKISDEGIRRLKETGTVAVMLPGASFFIKVDPAPGRKIADAGVPLAIATDYNPGTNPCLNLMLMATMGINMYGLSCEEAWKAITLNAAKALGLQDRLGSIAVGKQADLALWQAPDEVYPLYRYSENCLKHLFIKGKRAL